MQLNYSINGVSFSSLGIVVSDSDGVVDGLELKEPFSVPWPEANGQVVDLIRPRYEARTIKLDCYMVAANPAALINQNNALIAQLAKPGTQRLYVSPVDGKPLVFEVYSRNGYALKKKWRDAMSPSQFDLTLIEPQPVKWVLSAPGGTASLSLTTQSPITVYWGDGASSEVMGANKTVSHSYAGGGPYYVIVSGELQRMSVQSKSNLTEIWPRLY